jgi:hypothetical protein
VCDERTRAIGDTPIRAPSVRRREKMRPQAGVDRLKPVPPMHANDLPVVGQALSPANCISSQLLSERVTPRGPEGTPSGLGLAPAQIHFCVARPASSTLYPGAGRSPGGRVSMACLPGRLRNAASPCALRPTSAAVPGSPPSRGRASAPSPPVRVSN